MVSSGWIFLAAMVVAYGVANLLQSMAAARTTPSRRLHPGLLLRLAGHRAYIVGIGCQMVGFALAFLARRELPLFLVQAAVAAGLGVTAILGVILLRWRLPAIELVLLGLLCFGVTALVISARPAPSRQIDRTGEVILAVAILAIAAAGVFAARLPGVAGSVALGSLAGLAFGAAAVASRPLAGVPGWDRFLTHPLLYLLVAHSVVGQLLLGLAMQRGSTTAAVAAMDAAAAVPAALIGLLLLGDRIWPGRGWLAAAGFAVTLVAVVGLTRYAQPQHAARSGRHRQGRAFGPLPVPAALIASDSAGQRVAATNQRPLVPRRQPIVVGQPFAVGRRGPTAEQPVRSIPHPRTASRAGRLVRR